jgi:hypothetical protein
MRPLRGLVLAVAAVAFLGGCIDRTAYAPLPPASKCAISQLAIDFEMPADWVLDCRAPKFDFEKGPDAPLGYCRCVAGRDEQPWTLVVLIRPGDDMAYRQAIAQTVAHEMGHAWYADNDPSRVFDETAADQWACNVLPHATAEEKHEWCANLRGAWLPSVTAGD